MMQTVSKTEFKAHALEIFRHIEQSGQTRVITDHGRPVLEIRQLRQPTQSALDKLQGSVIRYAAATSPVADDDWEQA
jgi:antitoxin (DNA-binding transcriptional repressor) of toxin-antitoxin stability system